MKFARCHLCGRTFKHMVPDDAEQVTCFKCDKRRPPTAKEEHPNGTTTDGSGDHR